MCMCCKLTYTDPGRKMKRAIYNHQTECPMPNLLRPDVWSSKPNNRKACDGICDTDYPSWAQMLLNNIKLVISFTYNSLNFTFKLSRMYLPPCPVGPNTLSTVRSVCTPGCVRASTNLGSLSLFKNMGTASRPAFAGMIWERKKLW